MNIDYIKLSPTENITVLVTSPVPRAIQAPLAAALLSDPRVGGEQVGFIETPADARADARLQMMGGEFCGNATMALGAVLAERKGLMDGERMQARIEVSGCTGLVPCTIQRDGEQWVGTVQMPLPQRIYETQLKCEAGVLRAPCVELPGITHLIFQDALPLNGAALRDCLSQWSRDLATDALGALTWGAETRCLDPLVYVPSSGTLVREHGCGSGSAAIGCWLAARAGKSIAIGVRQPGGTIEVDVGWHEGTCNRLTITGNVTTLDAGTIAIGTESLKRPGE